MAKNPQPPKVAGIWLAPATEPELAKAETAARRYAAARGATAGPVYRPRASEGVHGRDPEGRRLLVDIRQGALALLVTDRLDSLAGDFETLSSLADALHEVGAGLAALADRIDTSEAEARPFLEAAFATAQLRHRARLAVLPSGEGERRAMNGPAPFGYRWRNSTLAVHPYESPVRALMFVLFAEHRNARIVARLLNERGFRLRGGARFSEPSVNRLLADPVVTGAYRGNHYIRRRSGGESFILDEDGWLPVEPIVPQDLWNSCAAILADQTKPETR